MRAALLLTALSLFLLLGCGSGYGEAQEAVKRQLIDPESAQFRDMRRCPSGSGVTGEVNSKNRMGGYVGFAAFYYVDGEVAILSDNADFGLFDRLMRRCHGTSSAGDNTLDQLNDLGSGDLSADNLGLPLADEAAAPNEETPDWDVEPMHEPYEDDPSAGNNEGAGPPRSGPPLPTNGTADNMSHSPQ